ncbi:hypothetical protein IEO21_04973 [Rhodonia placenta]|uniref:Uncharacterized protein n=1 Tax=Rhodonia placenta TaxID=104341 RepID=A0A8H7P2U5_9APHY|nr:hypothetical protein IEO21_04973 [Postia placenta]
MAAAVISTVANIVTTATPVAKPASEAFINWTPYNKLQRADEAQAATLNILAENIGIMERREHNILQGRYDRLVKDRSKLGEPGPFKAWGKFVKIGKYESGATKLNRRTVKSSQSARSQNMWTIKGVMNEPTSSDSQSVTVVGTQADDQEQGAANDDVSEDITDADPFRETDSVVVHYAGAAFSICDSESVYSESEVSGYDDAFPLQTFQSSS